MKSIKTLAHILRIFGWIGIIFGILGVLQSIFALNISSLSGISWLFSGLVFISLARGFSKQKKWAWYSGLVIFTLGILSAIILWIFLRSSYINLLWSLGFNILFLILLIKGKQSFIEQPKEKISQWFRDPYFIIVVVGTILSYLIIGGVLIYQYL